MGKTIEIGILGDFEQNSSGYQKTNDALSHAASKLSTKVDISWLPTQSLLDSEWQQRLKQFTAIWAGPGTYKSQEGAIKGIQVIRELDHPFIGT